MGDEHELPFHPGSDKHGRAKKYSFYYFGYLYPDGYSSEIGVKTIFII